MSTLYLRSAYATATEFVVDASYTLVVGKTATGPTDAVNKSVLDTAVSALTTVINTITGSTFELNGAFDQLPEIMTAVTTEISDRTAAVLTEHDARVAAVLAEHDARVAAIADEAATRSSADTTEYNARVAAVLAEQNARTASDVALQAQISDAVIVPFTSGIYADGNKPAPLPSTLVNAGHQGWYYKNSNSSGTNKINWYITSNGSGVARFNGTVGQIKELNIPVTLISKAAQPFITIYTARKGDGADYASWYRAKRTYCVDGDGAVGNVNDGATLVNGGQYLFRVNVNATALTASYPSYTNVDLLPTVVASSSTGTFSNDDTILYITIGTNSGALVNDVEFIVKHFEMRTDLGNKKMLFSNDSVMTDYLLQKLQVIYTDFYRTDISILV